MADLMTRLARVAADNEIGVHKSRWPHVLKGVRDLLGNTDADLFDNGQLAAALQGVRAQNEEHFFSPPPQRKLSAMEKIDLANSRLAQKEQSSIALFGKMEIESEEAREKILALSPARKIDVANEDIAKRRAAGTTK